MNFIFACSQRLTGDVDIVGYVPVARGKMIAFHIIDSYYCIRQGISVNFTANESCWYRTTSHLVTTITEKNQNLKWRQLMQTSKTGQDGAVVIVERKCSRKIRHIRQVVKTQKPVEKHRGWCDGSTNYQHTISEENRNKRGSRREHFSRTCYASGPER